MAGLRNFQLRSDLVCERALHEATPIKFNYTKIIMSEKRKILKNWKDSPSGANIYFYSKGGPQTKIQTCKRVTWKENEQTAKS